MFGCTIVLNFVLVVAIFFSAVSYVFLPPLVFKESPWAMDPSNHLVVVLVVFGFVLVGHGIVFGWVAALCRNNFECNFSYKTDFWHNAGRIGRGFGIMPAGLAGLAGWDRSMPKWHLLVLLVLMCSSTLHSRGALSCKTYEKFCPVSCFVHNFHRH